MTDTLASAAMVSGFYGKIPARGDFVRAGLPRSFVQPWDDWLQLVIAGSRDLLGARWLPAWMEAPIWRFLLPAGQCGPDPVLGVWLPSVDAAGRHFPLTLALLGPDAPRAIGWLDAAEAAGLDALQHDIGPEALTARLPALPVQSAALAAAADDGGRWWTEGSPFVPPTTTFHPALPDARAFATMIDARAFAAMLDARAFAATLDARAFAATLDARDLDGDPG